MGNSGIFCPQCGSTDSRVVHTDRGPGYVTRRRNCKRCGQKFVTKESVLGSSAGGGAISSALVRESLADLFRMVNLPFDGIPRSR